MSLVFTPATKSAPILGVVYRDGSLTGETLTIPAETPIPEFSPQSEIHRHCDSGDGSMPRWFEWTEGRKIELTGCYRMDNGAAMLAVYGAKQGAKGWSQADTDALMAKSVARTVAVNQELRHLARSVRAEVARRWGVMGTVEVANREALRVVGRALAETDTFPTAAEARAMVEDEAAMADLSPLDRLKTTLAADGDGWYEPGSNIVPTFLEMARLVIDSEMRREA